VKFFIHFFLLVFILFFIVPGIIFAQNEEFYNQVLLFGTDADIAKAFTNMEVDLGADINKKVLMLFHEEHSLAVHTALVRYMAAIRMSEAEEVLIEELNNGTPDEDYREDLIHALGKLKKTSSLPFLRNYYFNNKSTIRIKKAIIDAWGEIGDVSIEDALVRIVTDVHEDSEVKGRAIIALGKVKSVSSLDLLERIARNRFENKYLRMYAVYSLGEVGGESVLGILGELLRDESHEVAEYAVKSISIIASEKSGIYLIGALRSDYDKVRYYAAIGLGELQYGDAADILAFKAEYDTNEIVRREAQKALEQIQKKNDKE